MGICFVEIMRLRAAVLAQVSVAGHTLARFNVTRLETEGVYSAEAIIAMQPAGASMYAEASTRFFANMVPACLSQLDFT